MLFRRPPAELGCHSYGHSSGVEINAPRNRDCPRAGLLLPMARTRLHGHAGNRAQALLNARMTDEDRRRDRRSHGQDQRVVVGRARSDAKAATKPHDSKRLRESLPRRPGGDPKAQLRATRATCFRSPRGSRLVRSSGRCVGRPPVAGRPRAATRCKVLLDPAKDQNGGHGIRTRNPFRGI